MTDGMLEDVTREKQLAEKDLVRRAREQGLSLTGPTELLRQLTKQCWRRR